MAGRFLLPLVLIFSLSLQGQSMLEAEAQVSFVKESRSLEYYVAQSELWWKETRKNPQDEMAWWNYYRACRNVQGMHNWQANFVELGPELRFGEEILKLMEAAIPESFIYHYAKGSTGGVDPQSGSHLLKAYALNPNFPGMSANMVTYAVSTGNDSLRQEVNRKWHQQGEFNANWLDFAFNLLQSAGPNAILFTQGDNDTYPLWLLQDALGIQTDVKVVNIDFLIYSGYQAPLFKELNLAPFSFEEIDPNVYEKNWENVLHYFLDQYAGERPLHISLTVDRQFYQRWADSEFTIEGLSRRFKGEPSRAKNRQLFREVFRWDSQLQSLLYDAAEERLGAMTRNYQPMLEELAQEPALLSEAEVALIAQLLKNCSGGTAD